MAQRTQPRVTLVESPRRFRTSLFVEAAAEDDGQISCRVDILDNPFDQVATFAWQHGFGVAARFLDPASPATTLIVPEGSGDDLSSITCRITLGEPRALEPTAAFVSVTGDYIIR